MSDAQDWNTVGKHRKENVGQMANGGTRDLRKEKPAAGAGQRRASKQENRSSRPPPRVSDHNLLVVLLPLCFPFSPSR